MIQNKIQTAIVFAILFFTFTSFAFGQAETVASRTWEVQKYDITATLPQAETDRHLTVKAVLNLKNVSSAAALSLTLRISDKAEISAVKINGAAADFRKAEEKVSNNLSLQKALFVLPSVQPGANVSVEVNYRLKVDENSGLSALSPAGSQFLPGSFWYPTPNSWFYARGADFAPVRLQVNTPSGLEVISSGIGQPNTFDQTLKTQPFFVTGNWDGLETPENAVGDHKFSYTAHVPKGAGATERQRAVDLLRLTEGMRNFVVEKIGWNNNLANSAHVFKLVSVNRGAGFSDGGTILIDESAFRGQKIDSQTAMTIAESVAKVWIGNSVNVDGEGFGAVREGLARFIALEFLEKQYGKDVADVERLRQRNAYAAVAKRDAPLNIVSPLDDYFYSVAANKGAMVWRLLANKVGRDEFYKILRESMKDGNLNLNELRSAFSSQKDFLDYAIGQVTDLNLLVGLPQTGSAETKVAVRNTGSIDAAVNVSATTAGGEKLNVQTTIPAKSFGEVSFKTVNKIVRVEIDNDKFYPQTDYSDDVAPREFAESDALLAIKRAFDKQDFAAAEKNGLAILKTMPRFDDARIFLARSFLAEGKNVEAEREFRAVLDEKLPAARSLAWANVGLGEISLKAGQRTQAVGFFDEAIKAEGDYGASLAARAGRTSASVGAVIEESVKGFFAQFDKAAVSGRKADLDALIVPGEIPRFSSGISGQAQEWTTKIVQVDKLGANSMLIEAELNIKMLNKSPESGTAVFRIIKIGNIWKLAGIEMFEVR